MRYWVYINDKVVGPYDEDKLGVLEGFTPETLICAEDVAGAGSQEWVKASSVFEFDVAAAQPAAPAPAVPAPAAAVAPAAHAQDAANTQLLIQKIDNLTQQIQGMQGKLDEAIAAQNAANEKVAALSAAAAAKPTLPPAVNTLSEETLSTESLVSQAEKLVAGAADTDTSKKNLDLLDEIQIDEAKEAEKGGEEVVLRSALDSLYNAKAQTQEEKEATFQDLLSPFKTAAAAAAGAAAGAAVAGAASSSETPAAEAPVTEEKREEVLEEVTAPAPQQDFIAQAIAEVEAANNKPQEPAEPAPAQEPAALQSLELTDQPKLNILSSDEEEPAAEPAQPEPLPEPQVQPVPDVLTPMDPQAAQEAQEAHVKEETAKELIPGKKLEAEQPEEGVISQADLDEAFTERNPVPQDELAAMEAAAQPTEPAQQAPQSLPEGEGFYNPKEMTEVQLKEGSTYLISDFIPPAETGNPVTPFVPDDIAAAAPAADENQPEEKKDAVEEMVSTAKNADSDGLDIPDMLPPGDVQTKRGATMDIKTVPMVQDPTDSDRLDLTDSGLDINAQHDLKAADFPQSGSGLTKVILGTLVSLIMLAVIYVMLAYLEILPPQFNFLKPAAAAQTADDYNEMLDADVQPLPEEVIVEEQVPAQPLSQTDDPLGTALTQVQNYPLPNGQTLQQLINARHPAVQDMIEWTSTTAVEPDNYSILVKVPPENPQSFKISYRFNYNANTGALEPTISDSKNLLDSVGA